MACWDVSHVTMGSESYHSNILPVGLPKPPGPRPETRRLAIWNPDHLDKNWQSWYIRIWNLALL